VSEIPRYTSFPKELTELRKAVILMVMVCYSKRKQIKISKGKRCVEESPGGKEPGSKQEEFREKMTG